MSALKKICFVLTTPFAANAFLLGHLRALADRYHVSLCVNCHSYPLSPLLDSRVQVIDIGIERKMSPVHDLRSLWSLICLFRRMHFDAVHSMTPKAGLLAMLASWIVRVPHRYHTFTGQVWANKRGGARFFFKLIDRLIVSIASRVFVDSQSQCLFLAAEGVVGRSGTSVLGAGSICGVDRTRFQPDAVIRASKRSALNVDNETSVFLFIGRLARDKGVFDLLQAFSKLAAEIDNAALWVVGPNEEGLLQELQLAAPALGERVQWLGATFEPEHFMAAADVLMLPSFREGFPMVILEAAACGTPTVAYRIDGVTDAIKDGETGLMVPKGNIDRLAEAMLSLALNAPLRNELGQKAIEHVAQNYSGSAVTEAWVDFYRKELDCVEAGATSLG
jgi:glycosyltransferase involved in cell wall biosynthesis